VSLREEWYAARERRQEEVQLRQQQVADELSELTAQRLAMGASLRQSLSEFHGNLQTEVATFLEETRSRQQEIWIEERDRRRAYVIDLKDYVWGSSAPPAPKATARPPAIAKPTPKR
jgi:gas vesicle GvpC-like protein